MSAPTLCMIFESVTNQSAIAKIALASVRAALAGGWQVTVAAIELDPSIRDDVKWLKFGTLPRGFAAKWMTARHFIRAALGNRRFDVVHAYQPQVSDLSDVFHCQFLTRVAYERRCLSQGTGLASLARRVQQRAVMLAEDVCYRRWNPRTRMLFCSELLRKEFVRLYGRPPRESFLSNPCPPHAPPTPDERATARRRWLGRDSDELVVGYLGGVHERKGYRRLVAGLGSDRGVRLLAGGEHTRGLEEPTMQGRVTGVGSVDDVSSFYAACDVVAVPSYFDPCPLVVFEAVARGLPVIVTSEVGNLPSLLKYGAGVVWQPVEPLGPVVRRVVAEREAFLAGARKMATELSEARYGRRLLDVYDSVTAQHAGHCVVPAVDDCPLNRTENRHAS
jgi:glycosyltransferase involved in cell wall biosynthesis